MSLQENWTPTDAEVLRLADAYPYLLHGQVLVRLHALAGRAPFRPLRTDVFYALDAGADRDYVGGLARDARASVV